VTGTPDECRLFLGRWADEIMTVADPERKAVEALGLELLPAVVHIGSDGQLAGVSEGWDPPGWRAVTDRLARLMSWSRPVIPAAGDPAPYPGTPAMEGPEIATDDEAEGAAGAAGAEPEAPAVAATPPAD
jgi:hypothetical protein